MLNLHPLLQDHAVLQAGKPIAISGSAAAGATVTAELGTETLSTRADDQGAWSLLFPARAPGIPLTLRVASGADRATCSDLVTGEVWLCSGQSNMEWTLGAIKDAGADVAAAQDPGIRCFTVAHQNVLQPVRQVAGAWQPATPAHAPFFSAVAWFFARRLREITGHPVGLVVSAWGGTCIAPWMPRATLAARPAYAGLLAKADAVATPDEEESSELHPVTPRAATTTGWEHPDCDEADWTTLRVPGMWQQQDWRFNGAVWYRAEVRIPESWCGRELSLEYGPVDDFDDTFVNGVRVGGLGESNPNAYAERRSYRIPAGLAGRTRVTIAVRVFDCFGLGGIAGGGFICPAGDMSERVDLPAEWKARVELRLPLHLGGGEVVPTALYNGMIHPLLGFPLRGFLWYQGESDVPRAQLYRRMLPDLIAAWRARWNDALAPFGIVQLANYMARHPQPVESDWAELREAQRITARSVPQTGMAVAIDLGDETDIHPRHKRPVGERLAHWAAATVYGRHAAAWAHPDLADYRLEPGAILIRMAHAGNGLRARDGGDIRGFQIAGADRQWHWAQATRTEFDTVRLTSSAVPAPVAARYGWQGNPEVNLENSEGLPATPFRTDDWPLITA